MVDREEVKAVQSEDKSEHTLSYSLVNRIILFV